MSGSKGKTGALISVILPVYNGEKYLAQSIGSCLNQTYANFELIIVNDCSTDSSLIIAKKFAELDSRIKIISNVINLKLPASLNAGHKLAKGEFMTWTSDDNFFEPQALEVLLKNIILLETDIVFSNFNIVEEDGSFRREITLGREGSLILGNTIGASFLYTRAVFERNGGYDEELHAVEDYDFWLRALLHSKFHHVPAVLYNFRSHGESLSSNLHREELKFREKLRRSYENFFQNLCGPGMRTKSGLFVDLHQHREINVSDVLMNYLEVRELLKALAKRLGTTESLALQSELDLRLRDNLEHYPQNQNLKNLILVLSKRPQVFLNYDRRRSSRIFKKCLKVR